MNQISVGALKAVADIGRPNQRTLAKQRTREKIVAAAAALFSERGYEGATIRDIAKAAGMSTGAVFASFADKSDLFGEIVAAEQQALEADMIAAADERGHGSAVVAMLDAAAERHMGDLALFQATMSAIWTPGLGTDVRRRVRRRPLAMLVAEAVKSDLGPTEVLAVDRGLVGEILWDGYVATLHRAALERLGLDVVKGRVRDLVRVVMAGARAG
ncbi:MAG TPA: TetR/AcrR family transcriptional regulator [Caulobacteraceae bacterium]|nr:TetR/AcrR family transcriptional regulator [Caulobacteraceae bacterium]